MSSLGLGLAPVFVFAAAALAGAVATTFSRAPEYTQPTTTVLHYLLAEGRPVSRDFSDRISRFCAPDNVVEPGSACKAYVYPPEINFEEFRYVLDQWQAQSPYLLTFHPQDTILSIFYGKPPRFPMPFSLADGYSSAVFAYIVERSRSIIKHDLKGGELVVVTKNLLRLDELEWALLKQLTDVWDLQRVDETGHFAVYRLKHKGGPQDVNLLELPDRPVLKRNSFP